MYVTFNQLVQTFNVTRQKPIATFDHQGEVLHTLYYIVLHTLHYITLLLYFIFFFV